MTLRERIVRLLKRRDTLLRQRDEWKTRAYAAEDELATSIILPGTYRWPATVERWRSLVHAYLTHYGGAAYLADPGPTLDTMLGIMRYESWSARCPLGGDPRAISTVEWVGTPPPGYNPDDPSTKASGLFQIPPPYWPERSKAAGFDGFPIFDADANAATACYMLYATWPADKSAPHWHHWSAAHVGKQGSYEKTLRDLADGEDR